MLQPVLVRPVLGGRYELVAGERRWRAAKLAELESIPAIVRQHDDAASLEVALIENMAREDLNPVEEARACAALVEELGLTREEVGLRVGRSRVAVSNLIRLLELPDEALALLERGELSEGHGRALLTRRATIAAGGSWPRAAARERWSVRELEARARADADSRTRRPRGRRRRRQRRAPPGPGRRRSSRSPTRSARRSAATSRSRPPAAATRPADVRRRSTRPSTSSAGCASAPRPERCTRS